MDILKTCILSTIFANSRDNPEPSYLHINMCYNTHLKCCMPAGELKNTLDKLRTKRCLFNIKLFSENRLRFESLNFKKACV